MAELSSSEDFHKALAIATDQVKNKKIKVRFGPQGKMRFIIDEDGLRRALATPTASRLSEATFREIFHNEVGPLLEAVIRDSVDQNVVATTESKPPTAMVAFYGLGLGCSLIFATLLALSAMKVDTIHPFLSLIGLVGGLGWLTTAWTDLLLWKREKPIGNRTSSKASEANAVFP